VIELIESSKLELEWVRDPGTNKMAKFNLIFQKVQQPALHKPGKGLFPILPCNLRTDRGFVSFMSTLS